VSSVRSKYTEKRSILQDLSEPFVPDVGRWLKYIVEVVSLLVELLDPEYIRTLMSRILVIPKASIFNTSIAANTNIFSSDLTPSYSPTLFRIYACFNAAGVLTVRRTRGGTTVSEILNAGSSLNANCAYMFDIIVESGDSINLQYSVAATAVCVKVVEVPMCQ